MNIKSRGALRVRLLKLAGIPRSRRDVCCRATTDLSFSAKRDSRAIKIWLRWQLCCRTLRCTLHYASKLARSRCKANALFLRSRLWVCLFTEFKRVVRRCLTAPRSGALVLSSTRHSAIEMNICKFVYLNYWFQGTNMLYKLCETYLTP